MALALLAGATANTSASSYGRTGFRVDFTTQRPQALTGLTDHIFYQDEHDPNAKPKTFHKVVIDLPAGTRFDPGVVQSCSASDSDLMAGGAAACPAESKVGGGTVTVLTGFGPPIDPFATDVTTFQGPPGDLIDVITAKGSDRPLAVDHVKVAGHTLTDEPAPVPGGPPDGRSAVRQVDLTLLPLATSTDAGKRSYITTPADCPASRTWESRITVAYDDGTTDTATSTIPCTNTARPNPPGPNTRGPNTGTGPGGPSGRACSRSGTLRLRISQRHGRVTRVVVYVDRKRVKRAHRRRIRAVSIRTPNKTNFKVKIVAATRRHKRFATVIRYHNCSASKPRARRNRARQHSRRRSE